MTETERSNLQYALERIGMVIYHLDRGATNHAKGEAVNVKDRLRRVLGKSPGRPAGNEPAGAVEE